MGGGREPKKGQHETEGAEGGNRPQLKKKERDTEGRQREERKQRAKGGRGEKGEGAKRVTSPRAASAHGAGEKLWESKQHRRIPICVQPLAALTGHYEDEWGGLRVHRRLPGLKGHQGSA